MIDTIKSMKPAILSLAIVVGFAVHCTEAYAAEERVATVAGGCFWCVESDFESVKGVREVVSGFTGGTVENPTYRQVTGGKTGHIEAVQIFYDPDVVSYETLLTTFMRSIDPLDGGGQFCDRGFTYSPAIFPSTEAEKTIANKVIAEAEQELGQKVQVPVKDASPFYLADDYHQDYYKKKGIVLTRFGPTSKAEAYKKYRAGCQRDERVQEVWGSDAPFVQS